MSQLQTRERFRDIDRERGGESPTNICSIDRHLFKSLNQYFARITSITADEYIVICCHIDYFPVFFGTVLLFFSFQIQY